MRDVKVAVMMQNKSLLYCTWKDDQERSISIAHYDQVNICEGDRGMRCIIVNVGFQNDTILSKRIS